MQDLMKTSDFETAYIRKENIHIYITENKENFFLNIYIYNAFKKIRTSTTGTNNRDFKPKYNFFFLNRNTNLQH